MAKAKSKPEQLLEQTIADHGVAALPPPKEPDAVELAPAAPPPNRSVAPPPNRSLTAAERYYIEEHYGTIEAAAIAPAIEVPEELAQKYLDELKEMGAEPKNKGRSKVEKAGFAETNGVVLATPTSSMVGDEEHDKNNAKPKDAFLKRNLKDVHTFPVR